MWLAITLTPVGADHGGLVGLTDDDHTIYYLLNGRSGGQTKAGLYFEVRQKGTARDPLGWLAKR